MQSDISGDSEMYEKLLFWMKVTSLSGKAYKVTPILKRTQVWPELKVHCLCWNEQSIQQHSVVWTTDNHLSIVYTSMES